MDLQNSICNSNLDFEKEGCSGGGGDNRIGGGISSSNGSDGSIGGGISIYNPKTGLIRPLLLQEEIGCGSSCSVRQGIYEGSKVAVKILRPELLGTSSMERFLRESHLLCRISHPNIVYGIATGTLKTNSSIKTNKSNLLDLPLLVMEFINGPSLDALLHNAPNSATNPRLKLDEALKITAGIASALDYLHRDGTVTAHRDIKPANIMITKDGTAKLIDLGIAKTRLVINAELATKLAGTTRYMPPEQLTDSSRVDIRSDIYALGIVFSEMLGINRRADPRFEMAKRLIGEVPQLDHTDARQHRLSKKQMQTINQILSKMCAFEPHNRYQSAAKLAEQLRGLRLEIRESNTKISEAIHKSNNQADSKHQQAEHSKHPKRSTKHSKQEKQEKHRLKNKDANRYSLNRYSLAQKVSDKSDTKHARTQNRKTILLAVGLGAVALVAVVLAFTLLRPSTNNSNETQPISPPTRPEIVLETPAY